MSRNEQIKERRRRRNSDALGGRRRRLALDESKLDRENFVYRFANDDKNRLYDLCVNDDWEVVKDYHGELNDSDGAGTEVAVKAGTGSEGQSMNTVLLRKPKTYHDEDFAARQRAIDEKEKALTQLPEGADKSTTYSPDGIKVGRA